MEDISIISNSCVSGYFYKKCNMKYSSPTVWCAINNFMEFCSDLDGYLEKDLIWLKANFDNNTRIIYPVCTLQDKDGCRDQNKTDFVEINFIHTNYKSFDKEKEKWERRKQRIIKDKIVIFYFLWPVIDYRRSICEYKKLQDLPFTNKVAFCLKGQAEKIKQHVTSDIPIFEFNHYYNWWTQLESDDLNGGGINDVIKKTYDYLNMKQ